MCLIRAVVAPDHRRLALDDQQRPTLDLPLFRTPQPSNPARERTSQLVVAPSSNLGFRCVVTAIMQSLPFIAALLAMFLT